jgi:hypothetical protein
MFVHRITLLSATMAALVATPALAQKQYGPGVSDTEIKIGQTIAYSGPASAYGTLGRAPVHYPMLKNSKIAGLRKSRKCSASAISPAARSRRIDTRASDRFAVIDIAPQLAVKDTHRQS